LTDIPLWITLPFLFVLGAALGSFLNVCIYRMPRHERLWEQLRGISWPASHCPSCKQPILRSDNVPIFGWLLLRGRCRFCRVRISPRYPLIELLNGLLFVAMYLIEIPHEFRSDILDSSLYAANGPQIVDVWSTVAWLHWRYLYHMILLQSLLVATFIDLDEMTIPDGATVPAMIAGLLGGFALGQVFLVPAWFQSPPELHIWKANLPAWLQPLMSGGRIPEWVATHPHWHGLAVSAAGLVVGGGVVWTVRIIGKWILKREAMGFGDVTLMAAIGSFVGWQPVLVVFFVAPFCAILVAVAALFTRRAQEIPYGPYLSIATVVVLVFWRRLWPPAERIFQLGVLVVIFAVVVPVLLAGCLQLVQFAKRLLGIPLYTETQQEWIVAWRPADQLTYQAAENVDDLQGQWHPDRWPGTDAARGMSQEREWRNE
jgi:leader peptidase (prepilin peptidase)/N-methyltransferase